jgi:hypothetical protein
VPVGCLSRNAVQRRLHWPLITQHLDLPPVEPRVQAERLVVASFAANRYREPRSASLDVE